MRTLHCCAGHGGGLLADLILGHTIVGAIERDEFAQRVLRARQAQGFLPAFPIFDDLRTFDGRAWRGAGKQLGEFDPRNLWPDALRICKEVRAPWFFLENVANLTSFDYWGVILQDLAAAGYDARWCVLSAGDVGAPHLRKRIWLLATDTNSFALANACGGRLRGTHGGEVQQPGGAETFGAGADVADANGNGCDPLPVEGSDNAECHAQPCGAMGHTHHARSPQREGERGDARPEQPSAIGTGGGSTEPDLGRMADGLADRLDRPGWWAVERGLPRVAGKQPHRADRLRGCGNGQVALCAAAAYRLLGGK